MMPVLESGQLAAGAKVHALEDAIGSLSSGKEAVAFSNMSMALTIALEIIGVGVGDEVLTLSLNCLSSNSPIKNVGATPVWVDVNPQTATMDTEDAERKITPRTKAIIVYHVAGYLAETERLRAVCDQAGIALIEDANAAFGSQYSNGSNAGSIGDFAVFSFYANRQVNGIEGAALICPNADTAQRARRLRRYGVDENRFRDERGEIDPTADVAEIGYSASMTNVNAACALANLRTLDERMAAVRRNRNLYNNALKNVEGVDLVAALDGTDPANWVMLLLCERRDDLLASLKARGIGSSCLHQPNHIYSGFEGRESSLPGTLHLSQRMIAIPCGWWIDTQTIMQVIQEISASINSLALNTRKS
ncbi:MAG: DegT/DnrJ/EryC1/StrS family aminotransferase [Erythrobacter sp.]|nr:DegT/DnrJ/EryC1/StrS family aminotransferase [Erythrobacter sp.]MBO6768986.1 DegT/DnrJ/EryC1/StrS family aminotransferase [Erythrobacter sp.]